jgi:hypothetical protein
VDRRDGVAHAVPGQAHVGTKVLLLDLGYRQLGVPGYQVVGQLWKKNWEDKTSITNCDSIKYPTITYS